MQGSHGAAVAALTDSQTPSSVLWRLVAVLSTAALLLTSLVAVSPAQAQGASAGDLAAVCPPIDPVAEITFGEGGVHEEAIDCFAQFGVVDGLDDGTFGAFEPLRRDQMASIIDRYLGVALGGSLPDAAADFTDVNPDSVHASSIGALAAIGIVEGLDDSTFDPSGTVTRAQMATFIVRTLDYLDDGQVNGSFPPAGEPSFDDVAIGSTHADNIDALVVLGIVLGFGDGLFGPEEPVLRGQVMTFFARSAVVLLDAGNWAPGPGGEVESDGEEVPDPEPDVDEDEPIGGPGGGGTTPAPPAPDPTAVLRINAGGPAVTTSGIGWAADDYFSGGQAWSDTQATEIANTTDDVLYLTERSASADFESFDYAFPVDNGTYQVRLHLAEIYFGAPGGGSDGGVGSRIFSVTAEGQPFLTDYDIVAEAGDSMTAIVETTTVEVIDGSLDLAFTASENRPKVSAIEILTFGVVDPGPDPEPQATYRINAGGPTLAGNPDWSEDSDSNPSPYVNSDEDGISVFANPVDIDTSHSSVPSYVPETLFQSERKSLAGAGGSNNNLIWTFPVEPGEYDVTVYFAEIFEEITGPGQRVFDMTINGELLLENYDVYAAAGGFGKAIAETFTVTDADATIEIRFSHIMENPAHKGIEIVPADDGEPTPGLLTATPTTLEFGEVVVDATGSATTTLTNTGGQTVEVSSVTVVGSDAFSATPSTPFTLEPTGMQDLAVNFTPTADEPATATLTATHDGSNSPVEVALTGTGIISASDPDPTPGQVLYRVNAGGAEVAPLDDGPTWTADTEVSPSAYLAAGGGNTNGFPVQSVESSVPGSTPHAVFETERWDPPDAPEMLWQFPVDVGTPVEIRLYLMNGFPGTSEPGQRIFDVELDGTTVISGLDLSAEAGHQVATVRTLTTTSDGMIDLEFIHGVENPLINGIEIVVDGPQPGVLSASPASVNFGSISTDGDATETITLKNLGDAGDQDITITGVDLPAGDYTTTLSENVVLTPGQEVTAEVTFTPSSVGASDATLVIAHDGVDGPAAVALSGSGFDPAAAPVGFEAQNIASASNPTSVEFGPDGRLYVSELKGMVYAYTVAYDGDSFSVIDTEAIDLIQTIPNHNDDGSSYGSTQRNVTGMITAGTAENPVLYVSSSDPRIDSSSADTNSGVVSRLTWTGTAWEKLDLVRSLPRSAHDHLPNGLALDATSGTLYLAQGGHTNMGAPSTNFDGLPEYALSAAILSIDLDVIGESTYDIPTLQGDVFGGRGGDNQATIVPGGPVQVHAPGFRNAYDVLLTEGGLLYTSDNGPNSGWGSLPEGEGTETCTNQFFSAGGTTYNDGLHLIDGPGYYGGHPNPTRGNMANLFGGLSPVPASNPIECTYLIPGSQDEALTTFSPSSNGLAEYTASNFGGAMQGDIITTQWNGNVARVQLNAAGGAVTSNSTLFSGLSGPLGVTAQGDGDPFPGTIWIGQYGGNITVFEPIDFSECDPDSLDPEDISSNGFTYRDLMDNGLDPCNPSQVPPDFDVDKVSDLNDPDIDGDGIPNNEDVFAFDPDNGRGTSLPHRLAWTSDVIGTLGGMAAHNAPGFTGHMLDPSGNTFILDQFDPDNLIPGGAAGVFTVESVTAGDAYESSNDQENAFHFGVDVTPETETFTVRGRVLAPFAGFTPQNFQSMGIVIGPGDQNNYVKLVASANGGTGGVEFLKEENGGANNQKPDVPAILDAEYLDLYLEVDPATGTVTATYALPGEERTLVGDPVTVPTSWLNDPVNGLAVGIISTSTQADNFAASWQFIEVYEGSGDTFPGADPDPIATLSATPGELYLGTVEVGGSTSATVTLTHTGDAVSSDIEITAIDLAGDADGLTVSPPSLPITLTQGGSTEVGVIYAPTSAGSITPSLEIVHTGEGGTLSVPVNAAATAVEDGTTAVHRINVGGPEVTFGGEVWVADTLFTGGEIYSVPAETEIEDTENDEIYRTERYGDPFSYTLSADDGDYTLRLHFAEIFLGVGGGLFQPGERVFNVSVDGEVVLANYDIATKVDGPLTAVVEAIPVTVSGGELQVTFDLGAGGVDNAKLSALELLVADGSAEPDPGVAEVLHRVNAFGGELAAIDDGPGWSTDSGFVTTDGTDSSSYGSDIATIAEDVLDSTPIGIFNSERWLANDGPMSWSFEVDAGTETTVRLYVASRWDGAQEVGDRIFDVAIDGTTVLTNFDIVATHGHNVGAVEEFTVTSDGSIDIDFIRGPKENPTIWGIEILTAVTSEP